MFEIAPCVTHARCSKTTVSLAYVTVYICWLRIWQNYNSLQSSQYGGVSPTKTPMMHYDVQALAACRDISLLCLYCGG